MLTSRPSVYLSGDFRLTGSQTEDDLNAQKLVPTSKFGWTALVSFTGIAKTNRGLDVGDWVSARLQAIPIDAEFDELPKALLAADHWLSKVSGYRKLAFSVVGFIHRRPVAMVISNFLDMDGNEFGPLAKLRLFESRPKKPEVRIVGDKRDVSSTQIGHLKKLLSENKQPQDIHRAMAQVNASAHRARPASTISEECVTGHLLPSGAGEVMPHGIDDQVEYMPGFVRRHLYEAGVRGFQVRMDETGQPLPPRWVGMTMKTQNNAVINLHSIRNVEEPIGSKSTNPNLKAFWKFAEANEPRHVTFTLTPKPPAQ